MKILSMILLLSLYTSQVGANAQPSPSVMQQIQQLNAEAIRYEQQGDYTHAISIVEHALPIMENAFGSDNIKLGTPLNYLGLLYLKAGDYTHAELLFLRALAIVEKTLGSEHTEFATVLDNLASLYYAKSDFSRAELIYQRVLTIRERGLGSGHLDTAYSYSHLANIYLVKTDYTQAETFFKRALLILEKNLGQEHPDVVSTMTNLAELYRQISDFSRAESLFQRSLAIRQKILGEGHPDTMITMNGLANVYLDSGDYARAEPMFIRAKEITEKTLGSGHPYWSLIINNLGQLYQDKGDYTNAEQLYKRALEKLENISGSNDPSVSNILDNLGNFYTIRGNYNLAESVLKRALTIRENALGVSHPDVAKTLNNQVYLLKNKGDYNRIIPLLQRSITISINKLGAEHPSTALSISLLADTYLFKEDYASAEHLYIQALKILERAYGFDHPDVAATQNNLALLYIQNKNFKSAKPLLHRALTINEKAYGLEHPFVATTLNNLAELYRMKGEYTHAVSFYQRALEIMEKTFGYEHPDLAILVGNFALLRWAQSDYAETLKLFKRVIAIQEKNLNINFSTGSEAQKQSYIDLLNTINNGIFSFHLNILYGNLEAARLAFTTLIERKSRVLGDLTQQAMLIRKNPTKEMLLLLQQLSVNRTKYANLFHQESSRMTANYYQKRAKSLEIEIDRLEALLSNQSTEFKNIFQPITLEKIQYALPKETALIEFAVFQPINPKAKILENFRGASHYAAYILHPSGSPIGIDLGDKAEIDELIKSFRSKVRNYKSDFLRNKSGSFNQKLVADPDVVYKLEKKLWQPIQKLIGKTKQVFIAPDGQLSLVPFEALAGPDNRYLLEQYQISYLTSGRDLLKLDNRIKATTPALVMADPDYDETLLPNSLTAKACPGGVCRQDTFLRLPGTAEEADAIAPLLGVEPLIRDEATERALKFAHNPIILHISTHGFFDEDTPEERPTTGELRGFGLIRNTPRLTAQNANPMLRSGLVLAGVNKGKSGDDDDGKLTALEASGLDLWGTELVVLSACDTGVGSVKKGEGVYGLRRAFVNAGSNTQVMSLWKVDDTATRELMVDYYQRLKAGEGRAEAMRQAKLSMMRKDDRRHPFFWASFIVSGDWRKLDYAFAPN